MSTQHVVVIGAGIGGLSTAITLAGKGIPVTIVEKSPQAGGKIRQVEIAGKLIDAGPTVFTMRWVFDKLFKDAGLQFDDHINLIENALLARHSWVGSDTLDLFTDTQLSAEAIEKFAGRSQANCYRQFVKKTEALFDTLNKPFMQAERPSPLSLTFGHGANGFLRMSRTQPYLSLWRALSQTFQDPRLVMLFARYATYCGSSPLQAPATLMLIAHVEKAGVWVIEGGMQALANALLEAAKSLGCHCMFGQTVETILTDSSGVRGVKLDSGAQIDSNTVVFNGDTNALANGNMGHTCSHAVAKYTERSLSAITRCQLAEPIGFDLAHHNVFFGNDYPAEFKTLFEQNRISEEPTIYVCAQDRLDLEQGAQGSKISDKSYERLFSLMNAPARSLTKLEITQACDAMTHQLHRHGLTLTNEHCDAKVETPNTFAELYPATQGALYGRPTHGMMGSFKRPSTTTAVKGLYLVGGSVHPGPGVPMVALSGQMAARRILSD